MTSEDRRLDGFSYSWIRSSGLGWLLGLALLTVLALLADLLGSGEGESQFMVGVGIGLGVGYAQGRTLRAWLGRSIGWIAASTLGMGALFVLHDIAAATGMEFPYSLPLYVLVGGLLTGLWQGALLRRVSERARWWPIASVIAWGVPALCVALGDASGTGVIGDIASLTAILLGGGMLGATSGGVLRWILARPAVGVGRDPFETER